MIVLPAPFLLWRLVLNQILAILGGASTQPWALIAWRRRPLLDPRRPLLDPFQRHTCARLSVTVSRLKLLRNHSTVPSLLSSVNLKSLFIHMSESLRGRTRLLLTSLRGHPVVPPRALLICQIVKPDRQVLLKFGNPEFSPCCSKSSHIHDELEVVTVGLTVFWVLGLGCPEAATMVLPSFIVCNGYLYHYPSRPCLNMCTH